MNDLLEELVGDLEDDDTIPEKPPLIEPIDSTPGRYTVWLRWKRFRNDWCNATEDDYDTFGDWYSAFRVHPRGWKHPRAGGIRAFNQSNRD